jgi:hypothetical protein
MNSLYNKNKGIFILYGFLYIGLAQEPGWFFHESRNFLPYGVAKLRFLAEIIQ